jgi:uncharacterized repeat protein (TIGR02543 family)
MDVKLAKVTFKAKQRYKVTFFVDSSPGVTYDIISGNTFNKSAIPASVRVPTKAGYKFDGWYDSNDWEGTPAPTAVTSITTDAAVYAKWSVDIPVTKPELDPVSVTVAGTGTLFSAVGSYNGGGADATGVGGTANTVAGTTYTYDSKTWWIVANGHSGNYTWGDKIADFPQVNFDAIKAQQANSGSSAPGYTRIAIDLEAETWTPDPTAVPRWAVKWYDQVKVTYDMIPVGGSGNNSRTIQVRNDKSGGGGAANSSFDMFALTAGNNQTFTVPIASLSSGGITIVKNGNGALLLRIIKVELLQE